MSGAEYLLFILMLSIFLGFELINKVPATLHTPLMSGANAISGITVVGAVALAGTGNENAAMWLRPRPPETALSFTPAKGDLVDAWIDDTRSTTE